MKKKYNNSPGPSDSGCDMNRIAEANLNESLKREAAQPVKEADMQRHINKLEARQTELEMEKKLSQDQLSDSIRHYRTLFDRASEGIMILSTEEKLVNLNESLAAMHGYSVKEIMGMDLKCLNTPESNRLTPGRLHRIMAGENLTFETEHYHKDDHVFPLEVSASLISMEGEDYIQCFLKDITERKLRENRWLLQSQILTIINNTASTTIDVFSRIILLIKEFSGFDAVGIRLKDGEDFPYYQTLGFPAAFVEAESTLCSRSPLGELLRDQNGSPVLECMCGNVLSKRTDPAMPFFTEGGSFWTNSTSELLAATSVKERQTLTRNRCNSEGYESVALVPLKVGDQHIGLIQLNDHRKGMLTLETTKFYEDLGNTLGIAFERGKMVDELHKSEERYRRITEAITDYIYTVQLANGKPVNTIHGEACFAVTGYTREEFAKDPYLWIHMVPEEDHNIVRQQIDSVLSGHSPEAVEHRIRRKDGVLRWIESTVILNTDAEGRDVSYYGIVRDITDNKTLKNQLLHSQKMEAVGQLAGGVAHDFNNILSAIVNYAYILQTRAEHDASLKSGIKQIISLSMKASDITSGLLAFSRKHFMNPSPLKLNDSVRSMDKLLSKFIGEDIDIFNKLTEQEPVIMADSTQVEQIIMNLATNARDAMPDGGTLSIETDIVTLGEDFIKTHGYGSPGTYAVLTVSDTGSGMDETTKQKIFEPFFTTKEVGKGTGLGLAILYGIVKHHEGFINVYSEPGKGTAFKIYFRVVRGFIPERYEISSVDMAGKGETVLLAEDEADVRASIKIILEKFGYKVIEAVDGADAVEKYMAHRDSIDLLLFDVITPKKNGKEAYEEIKKITPDIKIIFTSGYNAEILDRKGIISAGFNHVSKPVLPVKLISKIKEVLQNGPSSLQ